MSRSTSSSSTWLVSQYAAYTTRHMRPRHQFGWFWDVTVGFAAALAWWVVKWLVITGKHGPVSTRFGYLAYQNLRNHPAHRCPTIVHFSALIYQASGGYLLPCQIKFIRHREEWRFRQTHLHTQIGWSCWWKTGNLVAIFDDSPISRLSKSNQFVHWLW